MSDAHSAPALSNVPYDDLVVGERFGPYQETITQELASRLSGPIGEDVPVGVAPPAVYPVLFLRALRQAMGGIPAGSILAKQELEFHRAAPVGSVVGVSTWVGSKEIRRERPFVTIEFDIRDEEDRPVLTGRKIIVWPTGPGERA
jgi:hypothetical protein